MLLSSTPEIEDLRPGSVQMRFVAVTEPAQLDWQVADRDGPYPGGNRSEVETLKRRSSPPGSDNLCPRQTLLRAHAIVYAGATVQALQPPLYPTFGRSRNINV